MAKTDDKAILRLLANGNKEEAFRLLVSRYKERLYWHIRKIVIVHADADDVLQNTMISVWTNFDKFRKESGLFTWAYRIATNEALALLRQKKRRSLPGTNDISETLADTLEADSYFSGGHIQKELQKAILKLPEKQRLVFNMRYFDEMKYQDMAKILDTSEGALKASYHHAVKKIETTLKAQVNS